MGEHKKAGSKKLVKALNELADTEGVAVEELDLESLVGKTAGRVYHALELNHQMDLKNLKDDIGVKGPIFMASLGWLMREGKLNLSVDKNTIKISLK